MLQSIINSNFFKNNPDKVLGVPYQTKGRWGEVTKYKGTMLDLDKINVPDYIVADMLMPNMSSEAYLDLENLQPAAVENIKIAIKKAKQEKIVASQSSDNAKLDIVTFEEVDARYNAHLSTDEKQAFVYYMYRVLGRNMQGGWRKYIVPANQEKQKIQDWISKGIVYYSNKIIVPSFVYFSGEMWQKENDLEHEKDFIIEEYGEAAYQAQKESFAKAKQDPNSWYNKRLLIDDPIAENRLVLKPNCELAKTFQIQGIKSTSEALVGTKTKNGVKTIDFKKDPTSKYDRFSKTIKDEDQPLQFWFIIWLKDKAKKQEIAIKKGLDWQEVYEIGVTGRKRHEDEEKDAFTKKKANAKAEAQRLFSQFLIDELELNDKVRLENQWNIAYNGSALMDLEKVPIGFSHARVYGGMEIEVRPEKREAVAFAMMQGTGCLAYGVGLGKTWCAVFIMAQFMENGWAERPLLAVPNQVYKQFMNEIKGICPQYQVNDLYNLSTEYESRLQKKNDKFSELKSQSITIVTYEGFKKLGLGNEGAAIDAFQARLSDIYSQQGSNQSETQRAKREEKNEGKVGQSVRGSYISVIDLEIDMLLVDEAHSMKKVFTEVKSKEDEDGRKGNKKYNITSGTPSIMAQKGFMIAQYIQFKKKTGNCIILTATPFTNSPLEVFSMLALINYPLLNRKGYFSLETFFDNFADIQNELTISATLQPVMKEIFVGFNNLPALHKLIQECFLYKQSVANLQRPNKIVLPLREKLINGVLVPLADREKIDTNLQMTSLQSKLMSDIVAYAEGRIEFDQLENSNKIDFDDEEENEDDILDVGETISEKSLTKEEDKAVRLLRAMNFMRSLALSPYLYKYSGLGRPKYKDYIETSAKLNYVIQCVKSVKLHHESNGTPVSGQVIYMNRGVEYFDLIKEYLVKEVGFAEHEIGIIRSSMPKGKDKSWVQDRFLGRRFDEITREFSDIPDSERIKVLIGSATIQEGINLQTYGTVLYNCFLDWNPTSVIQLEGRIWRQGNQYSNVRIVNPMLEESMDIFMFQKLEEKTNRINVLFDYNGNTSTINLEEFNAKELKYALIKDPLRVAKLEAQEQKELLQDDLQGFRQILKSMDLFLKAKKEVESNVKNLLPFVKVHRDITHDDNFFMENPKILNNFILAILREQTFKDGTKLKDFTETEAKDLYYTYNWSEKQVNKIYFEPSKRSSAIYDDDITPHKFLIQEPYGIQVFQENVRIYQNFISKFSSTRNVKLNNATEINNFNLTIQKDINSINEKIDAFEEEDFLQNRAAEITAYRVKNGIESATVAERANQFASLNYLLDKKRVVMPTVAKVEKKPVISIQKYIDYAKNLRARQR